MPERVQRQRWALVSPREWDNGVPSIPCDGWVHQQFHASLQLRLPSIGDLSLLLSRCDTCLALSSQQQASLQHLQRLRFGCSWILITADRCPRFVFSPRIPLLDRNFRAPLIPLVLHRGNHQSTSPNTHSLLGSCSTSLSLSRSNRRLCRSAYASIYGPVYLNQEPVVWPITRSFPTCRVPANHRSLDFPVERINHVLVLCYSSPGER